MVTVVVKPVKNDHQLVNVALSELLWFDEILQFGSKYVLVTTVSNQEIFELVEVVIACHEVFDSFNFETKIKQDGIILEIRNCGTGWIASYGHSRSENVRMYVSYIATFEFCTSRLNCDVQNSKVA